MFAAPLNVWNIDVYRENGGEPLSYFRLHLEIDNDPGLWSGLNDKIQGPIDHFPKLILFRQGLLVSGGNSIHQHVYTFRKPWLYSLERNFKSSTYTRRAWKNPVLGIAFEKNATHKAAIDDLLKVAFA
jgi:hypothetical protein